jgi:hypothetical protein
MLVLDYTKIASNQFHHVEKQVRNNQYFSILGSFSSYFVKRRTRKLNTSLTGLFLESKGILAELKENIGKIEDKTIKEVIVKSDSIISKYSVFRASIEVLIEGDKENKYPEFKNTLSIITETLAIQFDILRLLKRYSKKSHTQTSAETLESNRRSLNSLESIMNGHRTT